MSMTKATTTTYIAVFLVAGVLVGASMAQASEVTGTLSSQATDSTQTNGNISGTVSSVNDGGSSSSGGSSGRGGGSSSSGGVRSVQSTDTSDEPTGVVLGAATDTIVPGFPNAGVAPAADTSAPTRWSTLVSFVAAVFQVR